MKQGSTDDPFAEDERREAPETDKLSEPEGTPETRTQDDSSAETADEPAGSARALPYIYARDSVKDGRQQRPIFLREEVEDGIPELVQLLESSFGEDVYRTDVLEAAVVVAQENPELVEEEMTAWGYGWE